MSQKDYHNLADLLESHKDGIAVAIARQTHSKSLIYFSSMEISAVAKYVQPALNKVADYLKTGNLTAWSDYMDKQSRFMQDKGMKANEFAVLAEIIFGEIRFFLRQAYPGAENEIRRERLTARLQGLYTIGVLSNLNNSLRKPSAA
jgi:hypothetical protein